MTNPAPIARTLPSSLADSSKVRLGGTAPALPTADPRKVRLGGTAPALPTADPRKVRLA